MEIWWQNRGRRMRWKKRIRRICERMAVAYIQAFPFIILGLLVWIAICLYHILSYIF